jgi:hypothetical protein
MATTRRARGGFLGIKKAVKSLYQTKKQNKRMYKLSRARKLKRLQEQKERSLRRFAEQRANIENAAY